MNTTRRFVYAHRAKLAWKQIKHGTSYLAPGRQGDETFKPFANDAVLPGDFIETPIRH